MFRHLHIDYETAEIIGSKMLMHMAMAYRMIKGDEAETMPEIHPRYSELYDRWIAQANGKSDPVNGKRYIARFINLIYSSLKIVRCDGRFCIQHLPCFVK